MRQVCAATTAHICCIVVITAHECQLLLLRVHDGTLHGGMLIHFAVLTNGHPIGITRLEECWMIQ